MWYVIEKFQILVMQLLDNNNFSGTTSTRAIITHGLYIFYPIFIVKSD